MEKTYKEHRAEELQMSLNIKKERDEKRDEIIKGLKTLGLNTDDLYRMLAGAMITEGEMEDDIKFLKGQISEYVFVLTLFSDRDGDLNGAQQKVIQHLAKDTGSVPARALANGLLLEKSALGRKGAKAKLLNDPKQQEKSLVRECWDVWQDKKKNKQQTYKGKTAFARDMLLKYENLESQAVIVRWCGDWEKESVTQLAE